MSDRYTDTALPADEPTVGEPREVEAPAAEVPPGRAGVPVEDDGMPAAETLREAMKAVVDPEIGYNVVDLGLVYDVEKSGEGRVKVLMTLTTMGCPLTELIDQQVNVILGSLPGVEDVEVEFTFSPPWSPDMISEDVRLELRAMGMQV